MTTLNILSDSKIIASGNYYYNSEGNQKTVTAKYNTNGTLDTTYGVAGKVSTNLNALNQGFIFSSQVQANSKLLLFGYLLGNTDADLLMIRYTVGGSIDTTFGTNGFLITDFGLDEGATASITQPDGKIIVGGGTYNAVSGALDFTLLRYNVAYLSSVAFNNEQFLIYPSPFTDVINVDFNNEKSGNYTFDLFDTNGRKLQSFTTQNTTKLSLPIDKNRSKGNYFLKVMDGEKTETFKIIKQ